HAALRPGGRRALQGALRCADCLGSAGESQRGNLAMILALVLALGAAGAAVQKTSDQVRVAMDRYLKAQGPTKAKAREEARAAVGQLIDFDALAKSTLGKKWGELKPAEQKRYVDALRGAMEANYLVKMGK